MPDKPPAKKATAKPAINPAEAFKPQKEPLPVHKYDLAVLAISHHGVPSYEAWDMTVEQLTEKLEALRG